MMKQLFQLPQLTVAQFTTSSNLSYEMTKNRWQSETLTAEIGGGGGRFTGSKCSLFLFWSARWVGSSNSWVLPCV